MPAYPARPKNPGATPIPICPNDTPLTTGPADASALKQSFAAGRAKVAAMPKRTAGEEGRAAPRANRRERLAAFAAEAMQAARPKRGRLAGAGKYLSPDTPTTGNLPPQASSTRSPEAPQGSQGG